MFLYGFIWRASYTNSSHSGVNASIVSASVWMRNPAQACCCPLDCKDHVQSLPYLVKIVGFIKMKELGRFVGYTLATLLMIGVVLAIAKADTDEGTLPIVAIIIVVVLPIIIAVFMGRREKKNAEPS